MPHLNLAAGLLFYYVNNPLALRHASGDESVVARLVEHQLKADIAIALGLADIFAVGFVLPVTLYQTGADLGILGRPGEHVEGPALQDCYRPSYSMWSRTGCAMAIKLRVQGSAELDGAGIAALVATVAARAAHVIGRG